MKWWCSFLHGLDWLRLIEIENTYLLPGHDNSRHPVRAAGIPLLHFRHDSAKPQAADLHAPFALVDFRRNAMGMKIFLRIWFQNINKGKTVAQCLRERTDYAQNPEKTAKGDLVTGYQCDPMTVDEEFLPSKRQYQHITGKHQKHEVIAYQIRQSFKPGEITPEEANQVGYELAERFTKGKHAFIVATHTDRAHIHNHIIFNSTTLDCAQKFKDFYYSGLAIQRLSDLICLEHGLSIIEKVPYSQRRKRTIYEKRTTCRDQIRQDIDTIMKKSPTDFDAFLRKLEEMGYEVKRGKYASVKGKDQQRFVRFHSLGEGYSEEDIQAVIADEKKHRARIKSPLAKEDRVFNLLLVIDDKIRAKGPGYQQWATNYNLKQMAKARIFLKEHNINSMDELREKANSTSADFDRIDKELKSAEQRLIEITALKKNIINYAKTREVYVQYRKAGYSKAFFEAHREEITLHKAAKNAFQRMGMTKLPKVKELSEEYATVLEQKKSLYAQYRLAREEMREYQKALHNTEVFFDMDRNSEIDYHLKEEFTKAQTQK